MTSSLPDSFGLKRECTRDGLIMVEQVVQQPQAELKQAQVTAVTPMNNWQPVVILRNRAQANDPQIRRAGGDQQPTDRLRIAQMAAVDLKTPAFLVRKEGFDPRLLRWWGRCVHPFATLRESQARWPLVRLLTR